MGSRRLNSENISHNWELAQLLKSDQLKNVCLQHIKATFEATGASDYFIQLPSDAVLSLLRADDLQVEREESLFEAIGRWVSPLGEVDETRVVYAAAMMKEMRWYQVDTEFRYRLQDDDEAFWNKNFKCSRLLGRITKWIDAPSSRGDRLCPFNEKPRGQLGGSADSDCLLNARRQNPLEDICLLGKSQNGEECLLSWYDADTNTTQKLTDVTDELNAAFVAIEDCIFVIGGNKQKDNYLNLRKFDTKERGWTKCAPLRHWKTDHTAVAVSVGGETVICVCGGTHWSNECMLYSPSEDKWYKLPHLKNNRWRAAAVALPDGRVFVIGGKGSLKLLSSVETCHLREPADWQGPREASNVFWKDAAAMLEPRENHMAVAFRDCIFIAGGRIGQRYLTTVEVFTLPDDEQPLGQWTRLANWDTRRLTGALVVCQDRLFAFGNWGETLEFVPPTDPSTPSSGKFDLWTWVGQGRVEDVRRIQGAFVLHEL